MLVSGWVITEDGVSALASSQNLLYSICFRASGHGGTHPPSKQPPHVGHSLPLPQVQFFPAGQTTFFLLDFGRGGVGLTSCRLGKGVGGGVVLLVAGLEDAACLVPELLRGSPGRGGVGDSSGGPVLCCEGRGP